MYTGEKIWKYGNLVQLAQEKYVRYDKNSIITQQEKQIPISDLIHKELKHFSYYDIHRSIPSLIDGLKPTQRKILYTGFKYIPNNMKEIKVAQFSGYVSEHSGYHHGEASLNGAIINMAQNYVGSNNINIFEPRGQFGTRLAGGRRPGQEPAHGGLTHCRPCRTGRL